MRLAYPWYSTPFASSCVNKTVPYIIRYLPSFVICYILVILRTTCLLASIINRVLPELLMMYCNILYSNRHARLISPVRTGIGENNGRTRLARPNSQARTGTEKKQFSVFS